jgi:transcriptional regulator with XRE-family HTH domain
MTAAHKARYCRCGARLARDNTGSRCAPCVAADRDRAVAPPEVPAEFWDEVVLREALLSRHMGRVIRAWRTHAHHGRQPVSQDQVASWMGITQAQLSRIENGPPVVHLDRLIQWATVLRIPTDRLWFAMPEPTPESREEEERLKRRNFLAATGMTVVSGLFASQTPASESLTVHEAAQWLAWRLWQRRARQLDGAQVPEPHARKLDLHPHVVCDADGSYRFTDPSLIDALVAQRIYGDVASGNSHLLATAQTSYATDVTLGNLAGHDDIARRGLSEWMKNGATAVLRVNAAGVLSKVGAPDLGDATISAIRGDQDVRHLYLTAVASRVLAMPWEQAGNLAAGVDHPSSRSTRPDDGQRTWAAQKLSSELASPRDAAARWCSTVLLSGLLQSNPDGVRTALGQAAQQEQCRENLRAYAAVLAGVNPIT